MTIAPPINVVILNDRAFPEGGASKVALTSAIGLADRGHNVTLIAAQGPADPALIEAGVETVILGQTDLATGSRARMGFQGLWNIEAARAVERTIAKQPPGNAVVHIHSWSKALSASVFKAAGRAGAPVVVSLHDYGIACPNAALHDFQTNQPCARTPLSLSCLTTHCDARHMHHKAWRVLRQFTLRDIARAWTQIDTAICVSDYSHDILRPLLPSTLRMQVIENPIDAVKLPSIDPAANSTFAYVGRFSREKGVAVLATAAKAARLTVVFIGDGDQAGAIRELLPDADITGWLAPEQVRARLRQCRALVMPSLWRETQGMVVPEAFSIGLPVIASSGTAPAAAVEHGKTGLIYDNGDSDALADAMLMISRKDEQVREMGRNAYTRFWSAPSTLKRHIDGLDALYRTRLQKAFGVSA